MRGTKLVETTRMLGQRKEMRKVRKDRPFRKKLLVQPENKPYTGRRNGHNRPGKPAEAPQMETESHKTLEPSDSTTLKRSTFGRGKPKITRDRTSPGSPLETPGKIPALDDNMGPLTINTGHMTETEIHQAIQDAKTAEQELFIRDENGKVSINSNTKSVRRSKRLTKTNPIVSYNNPICHEYRKHRKRAELGQHTGSTECATGEWKQQATITHQRDKIQTLRKHTNRNNIKSQERSKVHQQMDLWRSNRQKTNNQHLPIGRTPTNS